MFEDGARLKQERGADKVYDFSLGNPCFPPPPAYLEALREEAAAPGGGGYAYMPNAGYPETRSAVASVLREKRAVAVEGRHVVMACGAAGGLNVVFKTLLDPGDEVIVLSPFFPEYLLYVDNHGGTARIVETRRDFSLDPDGIAEAVTPRTRAVLLNSPNNPTGRMYGEEELRELAQVLEEAERRLGRPVYLISDEPYGGILFDGRRLPDLFAFHRHTILVNSYSKSLSIAGERLGYIAVHPEIDDVETLLDGLIYCNRILGFVNAPATPQRILGRVPDLPAPAAEYQARRDLLCAGLEKEGYRFRRPDGAFYLFPESPIADDAAFVRALMEEGVLVVPGRGFGRAGFFRIAFCVEESVIEAAIPLFGRVLQRHLEA